MVIRAVRESDRRAVIDLLERVFGGSGLPFITPDMMAWKYDAPRAVHQGVPGWVAEKDGEIAAHAGVMPLLISAAEGVLPCVHLIDWASDPLKRGGGMAVYMAGLNESPNAVVFGGSESAKPLLPKMGFREAGEVRIYAKPLRPFAQWAGRPRRGVRELGKLVRNVVWDWEGRGHAAPGWRAHAASVRELEFVDPRNGGTWDAFARSEELYEYVTACPGICAEAYSIRGPGGESGSALIARVGRQARIADVQLSRADEDSWANAYRCCETVARSWAGADEIVAAASTACGRRALERLAYKHRGTKPVFLRGEYAKERRPELRVEMIDSDAYFLSHPAEPYLT